MGVLISDAPVDTYRHVQLFTDLRLNGGVRMQAFVIYLIITWIAFSVGFVLGAAWCGLGRRNKALGRLSQRPEKIHLWGRPALDE